MPEGNDYQSWIDYKNAGGKLGYSDWVKQARPGAPVEKAFRWPWETVAGEGFIAPWTPQVAVSTQEGIRYRQPLTLEQRQPPPAPPPTPEEEVGKVDWGMPPMEVPPYPTDPLPEGFRWAFDGDLNRWVPEFAGLTPWQEAQQAGVPAPGQPPTDAFGRTATWNTRTGAWDYPPNFGQRPADQPAPISPYQQQQFGLQQQQYAQQMAQQQQQYGLQQQQFAAEQQQFQQQLEFQQAQAQAAQEEQERQYTSQLAAQPINWLQYAAYTGEQPVIQPWMQPLGFQETEGALPPGYEVGQPIPGLQLSEGMFKNLPQLRTPSAQLQARWGPTAQAQFLGYRQARTGAAPEETQFRLGSQRAPTGAFGGFSRFR